MRGLRLFSTVLVALIVVLLCACSALYYHNINLVRTIAEKDTLISDTRANMRNLRNDVVQITGYRQTAEQSFKIAQKNAKKYKALSDISEINFHAIQTALRIHTSLGKTADIDGKHGKATADAVRKYYQDNYPGRPPVPGFGGRDTGWLTSSLTLDIVCKAAIEKRDPRSLLALAEMIKDGHGFAKSDEKAGFVISIAKNVLEAIINDPFSSRADVADARLVLANVNTMILTLNGYPYQSVPFKPDNTEMCKIDNFEVSATSEFGNMKTKLDKLNKDIQKIENSLN